MCQLFLSIGDGNGNTKQLLEKFVDKSNTGPFKDGYGISWYQNNKWNVYKNNIHHIHDTNYDNIIKNIRSNIIIAHLRRVYNGPNKKEILEEKRVENNHPFYYKDWVFVLHGDVFLLDKHDYYIFQRHHKEDMFKDFLLKITGNILPKYRKMIKGKTDSELIFYLFLSMWENLSKDQKMDPKNGLYMCLLQVVDFLQKSGVKYSFNLIIAKGKYILVTKNSNSDTVLLENKINLFIDKSDGAIVVSSSKITGSSVKMGVNSSLFIEF